MEAPRRNRDASSCALWVAYALFRGDLTVDRVEVHAL